MGFFLNFLDNPAVSGLKPLRNFRLKWQFFVAKGDFTRLNADTKSNFTAIISSKKLDGGIGLCCFLSL
jgi:hypothetical protein